MKQKDLFPAIQTEAWIANFALLRFGHPWKRKEKKYIYWMAVKHFIKTKAFISVTGESLAAICHSNLHMLSQAWPMAFRQTLPWPCCSLKWMPPLSAVLMLRNLFGHIATCSPAWCRPAHFATSESRAGCFAICCSWKVEFSCEKRRPFIVIPVRHSKCGSSESSCLPGLGWKHTSCQQLGLLYENKLQGEIELFWPVPSSA